MDFQFFFSVFYFYFLFTETLCFEAKFSFILLLCRHQLKLNDPQNWRKKMFYVKLQKISILKRTSNTTQHTHTLSPSLSLFCSHKHTYTQTHTHPSVHPNYGDCLLLEKLSQMIETLCKCMNIRKGLNVSYDVNYTHFTHLRTHCFSDG